MKNSVELRQERAGLIEEANNMLETCKTEARNFSDDEQVTYDAKMESIDKLKNDIDMVERQEKLNAEIASAPVSHSVQDVADSKEFKSYSFVEAFNAAKTGRVDGLIKEMDQEARNENPNQDFRGIAIPYAALESRAANTALTAGSNEVEVKSFVDDLYAASALIPAGANFYTGVAANQKIPLISGVTASFVAENTGTAVTEAGTIAGTELSPNQIIAATNVSNAAITQNASVEAAFRRNFASAIMAQFEKNLLGVADATGPNSVFADATATGVTQTWTNSLALARIVEMQNKLTGLDVDTTKDSVKLFMNADAYGDLLSEIAGKEGSGFLGSTMNLTDKTVLNIPYMVSSNVGNDANSGTRARALLIDVEKIHMAMFGGLDLLVDPYSQSLLGGTRLVLSTLLDGAVVQSSGKEVGVKCVATA